MPISILIAGSTHNTRLIAENLLKDPNFKLSGILTPAPKAIGRKQLIINNPLHELALEKNIPAVLIESKINEDIKAKLLEFEADILLVVDFGYLVPKWLLEFPKIAPVNIHPSDLPKFRGSSPGQFVLIFGETQSSISIIKMDEKLDHGPIIAKVPFEIDSAWDASQYYAHAFELISQKLPSILTQFAQNPENATPQPDISPTPTARMLRREDGYIPLQTLNQILKGKTPYISIPLLSSLNLSSSGTQLFNLWRGLTPWPGIWTSVKTEVGQKRVKLLKLSMKNDQLKIESVQIEGKLPTSDKNFILRLLDVLEQ